MYKTKKKFHLHSQPLCQSKVQRQGRSFRPPASKLACSSASLEHYTVQAQQSKSRKIRSMDWSVCPSICLSTRLPCASQSVFPSIHLSIYLLNFFETGSHFKVQAGHELTTSTQAGLELMANLCLSLPSVGISGMRHLTWQKYGLKYKCLVILLSIRFLDEIVNLINS